MELHKHLDHLSDLDADIYAISKDQPDELKLLSDAIKKEYPRTDDREIIFLSDPQFQLIGHMNMKNEDVAHRGYGMLGETGQPVFVQINDHFGEEMDQTAERIREEYQKATQ